MYLAHFMRTILVSLALTIALSSAGPIYERSNDLYLYKRDLADPPIPECISPCGPGCLGPYLGDTPPNPARRRSISTIGSRAPIEKRDFDALVAGYEQQSPNPQFLAKRNFFKVTEGKVDSWIKNKVDPKTKTTQQLCFSPEGRSFRTCD